MLNDIVNTVTFDFTCRSELTATTIRNDFVNYKAGQISSILSTVLEEKFDAGTTWKINRLEIDLGDILLQDIGSEQILEGFRQELSRKIDESRDSVDRQEIGADRMPAGANTVSRPATETSVEIIRELLLNGDLPWWIDKSSFAGLTKIFKTALSEHREQLRVFLEAEKLNPSVINRLRALVPAATRQLLNRLVPGMMERPKVDPFSLPVTPFRQGQLPVVIVKILADTAKARISAANQSIQSLLLRRIVDNAPVNLAERLEWLGLFSKSELVMIHLFLQDKLTRNRTENLLSLLERLNIFQLELISNAAIFQDNPSTPALRSTGEKGTAGPLKQHEQRAAFIAQQSRVKNPLLKQELLQASEPELKQLERIFRQYKDHGRIKKKLVELIIEHPRFLEHRLLTLLANLPPEPGNSYSRPAQMAFQKALKQLPAGQAMLVRDAMALGTFPSASARNAMVKLMNRLPDRVLLILPGLLQLNKGQLEALADDPAKSAGEEATLNKIVIENAGLCLLAPFLPSLFSRLGYTQNGSFKTHSHAHRAIYLLEYLVNGRQRNFEYALQLNKLLCGLPIGEPMPRYKRLAIVEKEEANDLLNSVIDHWKALKSTSANGLRGSFLQRKGILTAHGQYWTLQVEKKGYDVLMDSIPWSFNTTRFPWMEKMIQVEW
jgi:hypothetical protein